MSPDRIWIESTSESDALCVLGALADYEARLKRVGGRFRVEIAVDGRFDRLVRALHRAVRNCLDENGIDSVVFHVGGERYTLRATAA